jgi:hypothetical protein
MRSARRAIALARTLGTDRVAGAVMLAAGGGSYSGATDRLEAAVCVPDDLREEVLAPLPHGCIGLVVEFPNRTFAWVVVDPTDPLSSGDT